MLKEDDSFTKTPSKEGVQDVSLESRLVSMLEMFESKLSMMDDRINSISGSSADKSKKEEKKVNFNESETDDYITAGESVPDLVESSSDEEDEDELPTRNPRRSSVESYSTMFPSRTPEKVTKRKKELQLIAPRPFKFKEPMTKWSFKQFRLIESRINFYRSQLGQADGQIFLYSEEYLSEKVRSDILNRITFRMNLDKDERTPTKEHLERMEYSDLRPLLIKSLRPEAENKRRLEDYLEQIITDAKEGHDFSKIIFNWTAIHYWYQKVDDVLKEVVAYLQLIGETDEDKPKQKASYYGPLFHAKKTNYKGLADITMTNIFPQEFVHYFAERFSEKKPKAKKMVYLSTYIAKVYEVLDEQVKVYRTVQTFASLCNKVEKERKKKHILSALTNNVDYQDRDSTRIELVNLLNDGDYATTTEEDLASISTLESQSTLVNTEQLQTTVCLRNMNQGTCYANPCKFSHKLVDQVAYLQKKLKSKEDELKSKKLNNVEEEESEIQQMDTELPEDHE